MANRRVSTDAAELAGSQSVHSLRAVADDFAALAAVFERQLQALSASDETMRSHLRKAKEAAERGMHLSEELLQKIGSSAALAKNA